MLLSTFATPVPCRTAIVPACELDNVSPATDVPALAMFTIRKRDVLDFNVDFSPWLEANGGASLSACAFAVASGSPQTPTLSGNAFVGGKGTVTLTPATSPVAAVGDAYWIDVTATVAAVAATATTPAIPVRTLVRRFNVVVIAG